MWWRRAGCVKALLCANELLEADLEKALRETRDRGFNCVRADLGAGLLFDLAGRPREPLEFSAWIPGASENLHCVNGRGGGRHDVGARVVRLCELAREYGLRIIATSWLYQDFLAQVADARVREELAAVPYDQRLDLLARQWDGLLTDLRRRGLLDCLAFVELVNELDATPALAPTEAPPAPPTWEDWLEQRHPASDTARVREQAEQALGFLQARHPDVLFTVDFGSPASLDTLAPANVGVADHHVYPEGLPAALLGATGVWQWDPATGPDLADNAVLRSVLKPDPMPWAEFRRRASGVRTGWRGIGWLYHNLNNDKYDAWCVAQFPEYRPRIEASIQAAFQTALEFARPRGLPLVVDEGYQFYPPLNARLVTTPEGRFSEELAVRTAVAADYWGVLVSGYFRPDTPVWHNEGQCEWVRGLNRLIRES